MHCSVAPAKPPRSVTVLNVETLPTTSSSFPIKSSLKQTSSRRDTIITIDSSTRPSSVMDMPGPAYEASCGLPAESAEPPMEMTVAPMVRQPRVTFAPDVRSNNGTGRLAKDQKLQRIDTSSTCNAARWLFLIFGGIIVLILVVILVLDSTNNNKSHSTANNYSRF